MKERPILFSGPMVRAILEGRKTQTRRVVRGVEECPHGYDIVRGVEKVDGVLTLKLAGGATTRCPYGVPGDRLWVRETFRKAYKKGMGSDGIIYRADAARSVGMDEYSDRHRWRPSIFMPRWACRLVLEVTAVRVERLQDISEADAVAEGADPVGTAPNFRTAYRALWDSINAKRAPWASNPWVWVVEFRTVAGAARRPSA